MEFRASLGVREGKKGTAIREKGGGSGMEEEEEEGEEGEGVEWRRTKRREKEGRRGVEWRRKRRKKGGMVLNPKHLLL